MLGNLLYDVIRVERGSGESHHCTWLIIFLLMLDNLLYDVIRVERESGESHHYTWLIIILVDVE